MEIVQQILGGIHRLAQSLDRFAGIFQIPLRLFQPVFQQAGHVRWVVAVQCAAGVVRHGPFQAFKQVFVVDDITILPWSRRPAS